MERMEQDTYPEEEALQTDRDDFSQEGLSLHPTPIKLPPSSGTSSKTPVLSCKGSSAGGGILLVGTPLTPTANLKVLMSAVSPALREKERQERQQQQQASKVSRDIFASSFPKEQMQKKAESEYDRKTKSLGLLCRKFLKMTENEIQTDAPFSLEAVANALGINRRRIYDIINVFESLELAGKHSKNLYVWYGIEKLPVTLAKLKAIAEFEGPLVFCDKPEVLSNPEFRWRMQGSCLLDDFPLPSPLPFDGAPEDGSHPVSVPPLLDIQLPDLPPELASLHRAEEDDDTGSTSGGGGSSKNDRSLGLLCQKFIMLLLVLPKREVTLDFAAQVILADDETIDMTGRAKPKVRRLYDIANVLVSMGLIAKDSYINTSGGYHKPGFYWVGPDITDVSHIRVRHREDTDVLKDKRCGSKTVVAIQGRRHWCNTKHSLLNCYDIEVDSVETQTPSAVKRAKSYSAPTSPLATGDLMDVLSKAESGKAELNSLEVEAVLFGKEMKSLQDKYPNIYSLFGDFLKNNCRSLPLDTPSVLRNPVESDDKNEPMYIFRNFTAAARKSHSRSSSEGGAQLLTPAAKRPKVIAPIPPKQNQTSSLATHFSAASKQQKGKQRRSSESTVSATPPKSQSDLGSDSLTVLERQPVGSFADDWTDSAPHRLLVKAVPEMGIPPVSLAGGQQSCDTTPAPLEDPAVLPGQQKSCVPQETTVSPSIFLNFPRFPLSASLSTSPRQPTPLSGGSRVLVRPLGNVLGVGPGTPTVSVHQMLPANTCPDLSKASSSPTLASILSTLAPLIPPPPNTAHTGQRQEVEGQSARTASPFSSTSHAIQGQVIVDNKDTFSSDVVSEVEVQSDGTSQSSQSTLTPAMAPVMNPFKPLIQAQQHPPPQPASLAQQDMLTNLQNAKLLQSLLQVASTLPTQPLLPMGQATQGLSAPLSLQSLLQGVPPTSSAGYLPMAQPLVHLDTTQLTQSSKPAASPYLVRSTVLPPMCPVSQTSVASSAPLPVHQTQSATLSTVTGAGKKTASTAVPLRISVGGLKSAAPRCPKRTPLAQVNTNVTPVHDTVGLLKPAVRATDGRLPGVVGYHGGSPLLPPSTPVMLTEQCSVGYGCGGSQGPPLGDQNTRGQRETQADKETL